MNSRRRRETLVKEEKSPIHVSGSPGGRLSHGWTYLDLISTLGSLIFETINGLLAFFILLPFLYSTITSSLHSIKKFSLSVRQLSFSISWQFIISDPPRLRGRLWLRCAGPE